MAIGKIRNLVEFTIPGVPLALPRNRAAAKNGKIWTYMPPKARRYMETAKKLARFAMGRNKISDNPCMVWVDVYIPIPKSFSKKKRSLALDGSIFPATRPDADNYAKTALDILNGVLIKDDGQVVFLQVRKLYSDILGMDIRVSFVGEGG